MKTNTLGDAISDDEKDDVNNAIKADKAEKERAARSKRRAKTKYGYLMGDDR